MNRSFIGILTFFVFLGTALANDHETALAHVSNLRAKNASIVAQAETVARDPKMDPDAKIRALEQLEIEAERVSKETGFWKNRLAELQKPERPETPAVKMPAPMASSGARTAGWGSSLLSLAFGGIVLVSVVAIVSYAGVNFAERGGIISFETASGLRKRLHGYVLGVRTFFEPESAVPSVRPGSGSVQGSFQIGRPISGNHARYAVRTRPNRTPMDGEIPETLR